SKGSGSATRRSVADRRHGALLVLAGPPGGLRELAVLEPEVDPHLFLHERAAFGALEVEVVRVDDARGLAQPHLPSLHAHTVVVLLAERRRDRLARETGAVLGELLSEPPAWRVHGPPEHSGAARHAPPPRAQRRSAPPDASTRRG